MDLHGCPVIRRHRSLKRQDLLSQAIKGAADAATAAAGPGQMSGYAKVLADGEGCGWVWL